MRDFTTSADDFRFDVNTVFRRYCHYDVAVRTDGACSGGRCKIGCVQDGDSSLSWPGRRILDDLKDARHKPVLVDRMIAFCRNNIETDVVGLPIGQDRDEGRQIQEVAW